MAACTQRGRLQGKTVDLPWYEVEMREVQWLRIFREREQEFGWSDRGLGKLLPVVPNMAL